MYLIIALILALVAVVLIDVVARRRHAARVAAKRDAHAADMAAIARASARAVAAADAELRVAAERMAQRVFAWRNHSLGRAAWAHHNVNTRAGVDAWVRPRVTKQSAAIRAAVGGRSAESLWLVLAECQALTRIGNRSGRATDSGLHARINARAEAEADARSCGFGSLEDLRAFEDFMEERVARYEEQEAALARIADEKAALTRIGNRNSELRVHTCINRRAENRAWRAAKAAEHAARMAAMDAQIEADEAMWNERLALKAIWNQ